MSYTREYAAQEPARSAIDAMVGNVLLEFGTPWCGHCIAAQHMIELALAGRADISHVKVEDGKGRPLGRSFAVRLWPTLVFLSGGHEVARLVRPVQGAAVERAVAQLPPAGR